LSLGTRNFIAFCSYKFDRSVKKVNKYKAGMTFKGADKMIKRLAFE